LKNYEKDIKIHL